MLIQQKISEIQSTQQHLENELQILQMFLKQEKNDKKKNENKQIKVQNEGYERKKRIKSASEKNYFGRNSLFVSNLRSNWKYLGQSKRDGKNDLNL
ncbi:hypothetical protein pb186bvf_017097 [Paramecium bursaria]